MVQFLEVFVAAILMTATLFISCAVWEPNWLGDPWVFGVLGIASLAARHLLSERLGRAQGWKSVC